MTCKDCYHCDACKEMCDRTLNWEEEEICDLFKDKSRIVELPCKVGDFVEWEEYTGEKTLYRVNGFLYNPDDLGLRYILENHSPIVDIFHIKRIIPREEAEEALRKAVQK